MALRIRLDEVHSQLACARQHRDALLVNLGHRQRRADGLPDTEQQRQAWAHAQPDDTPVWRTHGADADAFTPTPV